MMNRPSRVPQLFFGKTQAPRFNTRREEIADTVFFVLQVISQFLVVFAAAFGYYAYEFYGLVVFGLLGYITGIWIRRSLGIRGKKYTTGFFARMRERALGSKPGLLEWLVEKIGQHEFTQEQCRAVVQVYDKAVRQLKQSKSTDEQNRILADLDQKVRQILFG
ncbi:MAG: hypothetical protein EHM70_19530 [Chloroflexota bacterium]|nr:MAG: hypothetical protein EHM70_19530 [Chloroflexota bacterium]